MMILLKAHLFELGPYHYYMSQQRKIFYYITYVGFLGDELT